MHVLYEVIYENPIRRSSTQWTITSDICSATAVPTMKGLHGEHCGVHICLACSSQYLLNECLDEKRNK